MSISITQPTNIPAGDRRPIAVAFVPVRPTTVPSVLLGAARILQTNGLWHGGYVPDPFDREMRTAHCQRPMNIVAAIRCAATGDPHRSSQLADMAVGFLALSLDGGPRWGDIFSLERHVDDWADKPGRSGDDAVALLELVATAPECAA